MIACAGLAACGGDEPSTTNSSTNNSSADMGASDMAAVPDTSNLDDMGGVVEEDGGQTCEALVECPDTTCGMVPDGCGGDPMRLQLLARRQALVLSWGRRRHLVRLARRLGIEVPDMVTDPVPSRFLRPYRLLGWSAEQ